MKVKIKKPNAYEAMLVSKILTIDINHITEDDANILENLPNSFPASVGNVTVLPNRVNESTGFMIELQPVERIKVKHLNSITSCGYENIKLSKAIIGIINYALSLECNSIILESCANNNPDMMSYNW